MNNSSDRHFPRDPDTALMRRARALHEDACAHVGAATRSRLAAARIDALNRRGRRSTRMVWLPAAGAMAACALVIGVLWLRPQSAGSPQAQGSAAHADAGLPFDADAQQLDLYQNLDFYQWLAQQPRSSAPPHGGNR